MSFEAPQEGGLPPIADHTISPRNIDFELGSDVTFDWHGDGPGVSNFFNVLSLLFPEGEKFFVISARHFAKRVKGDRERKNLRAFMTQEMLHTREHVEYNEMLKRHGIKADEINDEVKKGLVMLYKILPKSWSLAATVSLEHWTAIMAELALDEPAIFGPAQPKMRAVWSWHAIEETEHKAVCFDLFKDVTGGGAYGYATRSIAHVLTLPALMVIITALYLVLSAQTKQLGNMKGHWGTVKFLFAKPGFMRRSIVPWLEFLKPGFHPWDNDNRHHIAQWDAESSDSQHYPDRFAPAN